MLRIIVLVFLFPFFVVTPASASKSVTSSAIVGGEISVEWKGEYVVDNDRDRDGAWKEKLVLSHGFTDFWQSQIETTVERGGSPGDVIEFSKISWKNKFQFMEQGVDCFDAGVRIAYGFSGTGAADEIEVKLLGGRDVAKTAHRGNLVIRREVGEDSGNDTEWGLAWGSRYKYSRVFQPGFELHSDFGKIGHEGPFDAQDHRIGPVFYGAFGKNFSYDAGYLFGVSDRAPDGTVKAIVKYKW